jgi:hypothetical protein
VDDPEFEGPRTATCPKCGGESFYCLDAEGQFRKSSDKTPRAIIPGRVSPSPRLGDAKAKKIWEAVARVLQVPTTPGKRTITVTETCVYKWEIPVGEPLPFEVDERGRAVELPFESEHFDSASEWFASLNNPVAEADAFWVEEREIDID